MVTTQTFLKSSVAVAVVAIVLFLVWYFAAVVIYILVSAVLAIVGRNFVNKLAQIKIKSRNVPRWLAALITLVCIWIAVAILFGLLLPLVFNKIYQISTLDLASVLNSVEDPLSNVQDYISSLLAMPDTTLSLYDSLIELIGSVINMESINKLFSSLLNIVSSAVISLFSISFITFFFLKDEGLFNRMVTSLLPERYQTNVIHSLNSVSQLLTRYFTGLLLESFLLMIVVSLTIIAFGMDPADAFIIGMVMGVMNVVPYAGPLIGGVISIFIAILSPIDGATIRYTITVVACTILLFKGIDDFIVQPLIYSNRAKAHPLEIFLVILIAGYMAGIVGMLLAIPSYTVIRVFAKEFFSDFSLVRKLTDKI